MPSIQEKRQKILSAKLQEMGDIGVTKRSAEESPFFDQPVELESQGAPIPTEETSEDAIPTMTRSKGNKESGCSFQEYQKRFFAPSRDGIGKSGFTIHGEILQTLRDILRDVRSKATLTAYIENILLEHLKEHQAMLNKTAAQYKRNPTINLDL
ncbi:DUF3408 domain-containing protein [Bacteroides heparinolyticus]|uniref:DUF3408 domain-containing protein n=1 Tax=Prevotella heparinolytica TaxID=28113 RepID=A0A3P2AAP9_9BACE|nr:MULTISPECIES: DUF3408 domain-containing protein [Bacteroidales]KGL47554.1 conjugal transfer protein TraC [Porphyromonas gulae]KGL49033.1 conjugal transfer protein TraC [Porphyromonas cangingivalis]RRD92484.1 DUF3408 domain-containing protein [Bacteroides heparinolyticus]